MSQFKGSVQIRQKSHSKLTVLYIIIILHKTSLTNLLFIEGPVPVIVV